MLEIKSHLFLTRKLRRNLKLDKCEIYITLKGSSKKKVSSYLISKGWTFTDLHNFKNQY